MKEKAIYTWRTSKVEKGYQFKVLKIVPRKTPDKQGQFADTSTVKTGVLPSRDKAKRMAIKWIRFFRK